MKANTAEDIIANMDGINSIIRSQLAKSFAAEPKQGPTLVEPGAEPAPDTARIEETPAEPVARLPRRIAGGFRGVSEDLERRARDWRNVARLLEQQRPQLENAELESERSYKALARIVPDVQESSRALKTMIQSTKAGDVAGDLPAQFDRSLKAIEELEIIAEDLKANLLWVRSTWEQYSQTVIVGQKMREDMTQGLSER